MRLTLTSKSLLAWTAAIIALAVFLWPLMQGKALRSKAAQRLLDQSWNREYQALPILALAYNHSQDNPSDTSLLDQVWPELTAFKGNHPEFFWLTLSVLEQRAGRKSKAKQALKNAQAQDPKIVNMVQGPDFKEYRHAMGLGG